MFPVYSFPESRLSHVPMFKVFKKKIEEDGTLTNLLYEANITLIPKPENDTTRIENNRPIFLMNIDIKILHRE